MLALSAKRMAPSITQEEAELLLHSNSRLPEDVQQCYDELIAKRDAATLSDEEWIAPYVACGRRVSYQAREEGRTPYKVLLC
jgi:hypothetical protein